MLDLKIVDKIETKTNEGKPHVRITYQYDNKTTFETFDTWD